jgi:predicted transcriptional regulator
MKAKDVIRATLHPIRENDLKARRLALGLSRPALARILEVDPASVYRHERGPMTALWDYALRGIEAEAGDKATKRIIKSHKQNLESEHTFWPEQFDARGHKYMAEKLMEAGRRLGRMPPQKAPDQPSSRSPRGLTRTEVVTIANRAEARSRRNRKV